MSIHHYASRLQVKRVMGSDEIAFVDDDLSVFTYRARMNAKQSQIGLVIKKKGYQRTLEKTREHYHRIKESRMKQIKLYRDKNIERVKLWQKTWRDRNPNYLREWQKKNAEKVKFYSREYQTEKRAAMTKEQKQQQYHDNRAKMIEKYGVEEWRRICNERTNKSRQKRKQNENSKN